MAKKAKKPVVSKEFISKTEFNKYSQDTDSKLSTILTALQALSGVKVEEPEVPKVVSESNMPPQHQEMFEKYFDIEDGFTASIDIIENTFTIVVPPKFCNASQAHKDFYKVDRRMIKLDTNNPIGTIEEWCTRVAKELRYNKDIKTK